MTLPVRHNIDPGFGWVRVGPSLLFFFKCFVDLYICFCYDFVSLSPTSVCIFRPFFSFACINNRSEVLYISGMKQMNKTDRRSLQF